MAQPYPVTGVPKGETPEVHLRLEIRDLITQQPEQYSLFVRAFLELYKPDFEPKPASFVEMAGIHGMPYQRWAGDPDTKITHVEGTNGGYCRHSSVLFVHWHRVVVILIEQAISEVALKIAAADEADPKALPNQKGRWTKAARELRFPYWDWLDPRTMTEGLPMVNGVSVFQVPTVVIQTSRGEEEWSNPLAGFDFGPTMPPGFEDEMDAWHRTYRWPRCPEDDWTTVTEDYKGLNEALIGPPNLTNKAFKPMNYLRDKLAHLYCLPPTCPKEDWPSIWDHFSNSSPQEKRLGARGMCMGSFEEVHHKPHNDIGGDGHMSTPDQAAFEPLFFLYHSQVDRLLAFWEAVYPDYFMYQGWYDNDGKLRRFIGPKGTLVQEEGSVITEDTALSPFRKNETEFWTSADARLLYKGAGIDKYYTFAPIGPVDLSKPVPPEKQDEYIAVLQDYYSSEPLKDIYAPYKGPLPSLFNSSTPVPDFFPAGYTVVKDWRRFELVIENVADAWNGSHNTEVFLHSAPRISPPDVPITSITTIARYGNTKCQNCIDKKAREGGASWMHGVALLHRDVITGLMEMSGIDFATTPTASEDLCEFIKSQIGVRFKLTNGNILAETTNLLTADEVEKFPVLPESKTPRIRLFSAAAASPNGSADNGPFYYYDWQDHGYFLKGEEWRQKVAGRGH